MANILIVDDEESICWGLSRACRKAGHEAETAASFESAIEKGKQRNFDLVLIDVRLPGMDGLSAISHLREMFGPIPVIVMTAFGDLQTAIDAIQRGATEYLTKPFELEVALNAIDDALSRYGTHDAGLPASAGNPTGLAGSTAVMQELYRQIALATTTDASVLLSGESGTGKELVARSIHRYSRRAKGPFVAVNIASLSPTLAESELFGHLRGSFSGAEGDRTGVIQQATGGTLFLDEVADIPLELQVKLLRVLDLGEVTPVGGNSPVKTGFRLISASHRHLQQMIADGEFRHDLYYRLKTIEIHVPALRERLSDIPELIRFFLAQSGSPVAGVSDEFIAAMQARTWPGNVRELKSAVERAAVFARGGILRASHVPDKESSLPKKHADNADLDEQIAALSAEWIRRKWESGPQDGLYEQLLQTIIEPAVLKAAFELSDRQYSSAARRLGIHRTTLKRKLDEAD